MVKGQVIMLLRMIWNVLPELMLHLANWVPFSNWFRPH